MVIPPPAAAADSCIGVSPRCRFDTEGFFLRARYSRKPGLPNADCLVDLDELPDALLCRLVVLDGLPDALLRRLVVLVGLPDALLRRLVVLDGLPDALLRLLVVLDGLPDALLRLLPGRDDDGLRLDERIFNNSAVTFDFCPDILVDSKSFMME